MTVAKLRRSKRVNRARNNRRKDVQRPQSCSTVPRVDTPADVASAPEANRITLANCRPQQTKFSPKRASRESKQQRRSLSASSNDGLLPQPAKRCKISDPLEPTVFMRNMEAIVVNLERRPDRMAGCSERFKLHAPWLRHSRFVASDGKADDIALEDVVTSWNTASNVEYQIKRAIRKGWNDLDTYQVRQLRMSPGERGCAMSHIRAWRHCLKCSGGTNKPLLVLEDDAAPTQEFTPILRRALDALPSDAHVLYLGYSQAADWRRVVSEDLVEAEYVWTTVGYLVWPAGAKMLLSRLPVDGPVDNWMAGQCAAGGLKSYAVRPKIIHQADAWNVNSDVGHSDEHYWGPNSDIHHSDAFYWGNPNPLEPSAKGAENNGVENKNTIWADLDGDSEESDESDADC